MIRHLLPPPNRKFGWRIPDRVFAVLGIIVTALTWALIIVARPLTNDSAVIMLIGSFQLVATLLAWVVMRRGEERRPKPTTSNEPSPDQLSSLIFHVTAHAQVMTFLLVILIFSNIILWMVRTGVGDSANANAWMVIGLLGLLFMIDLVYVWWIMNLHKQLPSKTSI